MDRKEAAITIVPFLCAYFYFYATETILGSSAFSNIFIHVLSSTEKE